MEDRAFGELLSLAQSITDPRRHNRIHNLAEVIMMATLAVLGGAEGWVDVHDFVEDEEAWFRTFLKLSGGIPSHDTFGRIFARLVPSEVERFVIGWTGVLRERSKGRLLNIDGKGLRRSFKRGWDKSGMDHLVSAFMGENRLVLAQTNTPGKGHELAAIRQLLNTVDVQDAVVTIDALGCQHDVAATIIEKKADYVLSLKGNQSTLQTKVKVLLDEAILLKFKGMRFDFYEKTESGHGRIETRKVWCTDEVHHLQGIGQWKGLKSVAVVESRRKVAGQAKEGLGDGTTIERRYYISSLPGNDAKLMARCIRGHWGVENGLHWILDVAFREDECRIRTGHAAENFSRLRRFAMNQYNKEKTRKDRSLRRKRKLCARNMPYLLKTLLA